jgi:hypothetical protein
MKKALLPALFVMSCFIMGCGSDDNKKVNIIDTSRNYITLKSDASVFGNDEMVSLVKTGYVYFGVTIIKEGEAVYPKKDSIIWSYTGDDVGLISAARPQGDSYNRGILELNGKIGEIVVKAEYEKMSAVLPLKIVVKENLLFDRTDHIEIASSISNQNNTIIQNEFQQGIVFAVGIIHNGVSILPEPGELTWSYEGINSAFFQNTPSILLPTQENLLIFAISTGTAKVTAKYKGMSVTDTIEIVLQ